MNTFKIDDILSRKSCKEFVDESPDAVDIDLILKLAMSANDHGHLCPWEFRVYSGPGRRTLSDAFLRDVEANGGGSRESDKALKAPFMAPVVVCVSTLKRDCKIPKRDQLLSAAAACQLITLSAHLLGKAAVWKTGEWAVSEVVRGSLGISLDDEIVGFVHIGTPTHISNPTRKYPQERIYVHA